MSGSCETGSDCERLGFGCLFTTPIPVWILSFMDAMKHCNFSVKADNMMSMQELPQAEHYCCVHNCLPYFRSCRQ